MGSRRYARLFAAVSRRAVEAQDWLLLEEHHLLSVHDQHHGVGCVLRRHHRTRLAAQHWCHVVFGCGMH